jgi:hypothetical protein
MATRTVALRPATAEPSLQRYLDQIRPFPMLVVLPLGGAVVLQEWRVKREASLQPPSRR